MWVVWSYFNNFVLCNIPSVFFANCLFSWLSMQAKSSAMGVEMYMLLLCTKRNCLSLPVFDLKVVFCILYLKRYLVFFSWPSLFSRYLLAVIFPDIVFSFFNFEFSIHLFWPSLELLCSLMTSNFLNLRHSF